MAQEPTRRTVWFFRGIPRIHPWGGRQNCVFPLDAVRQLAAEGEIGRAAPRQVSFMGYQPDPRPFLATSAPEIAEGLKQDAVDAVLLVPV